ncbi:hypothetical protein NQ318_012621 [Aromia moschata]|uniref:Uncharacterized protein n=1 Tax=Aromia moschata TaxID=1265417 RepID=A0AAV8XCZ0_9CUCU|nr:hypothetical protein NQ318_012621 [Aromia moschata]
MRKNAHIKCKLFKSYLKMIQIDEPVAKQNVCGYYNTIERIGGHGQIGMRIGVMQTGAIVYLLTKQDLICFTPMAEC